METELRIYLKMLARGWWIILLSALLALNVSLIVSYFDTPIYRTSARFIVTPNIAIFTDEFDRIQSLDTLDRRSIVTTYSEVFKSSNIYLSTLNEFKIENPEDYSLQVSVHPDANIIEVFFDGPDPIKITEFINTMGRKSISYIREIYQVYEINFLDSAITPIEPIKPNVIQNGLLSIVIGLFAGTGLVLIREQLKVTIEEIRKRKMLDPISSAFTQKQFQQNIRNEMSNDSEIHSISIIRFNGLQELVDTLPPSIFNRLIRHAFGILKNELRGNDMVGRWNEISFVIFLPLTSQDAAKSTISRVQEALKVPVKLGEDGDGSIQFEPFAGLATRSPSETSADLIDRAEYALKQGIDSNTEISINHRTSYKSLT